MTDGSCPDKKQETHRHTGQQEEARGPDPHWVSFQAPQDMRMCHPQLGCKGDGKERFMMADPGLGPVLVSPCCVDVSGLVDRWQTTFLISKI